jgi:hypothetical protein
VTLDFYANTPDASNAHEGERYLGSHSFVAAAGATPFTAVLPDVVLPAGTFVTSTTTDAEGNTSEFGGGIEVTANAKAPSVTVVTCENAVYNGVSHTTCTASVTGEGGLNQALPVSYTDNVNAGIATGSATFAGDDDYEASADSTTFEIAKAPSVTVVTCADVIYNGAAQAPCTANVTGIGGLDQAVAVTYADNVNVGTASASASYAGDPNHDGSSATTTFTITAANTEPVCRATASIGALWPPNHRIVPIDIVGVTDPDGDAVAIHVDRILQDEPTNTTGDGNTTVDGGVLDGATRVWVRAERSGTPRVPGDGRVYEILFTATDAGGARCTGVVTVGVPHDMGRPIAVDSGVRYDSTTGARVP